MIQLSVGDIELLLDALARGASRHQSLATALKIGGHFAGKHDRAATAMRDLRARLLRAKIESRPQPIKVILP
jgi:hypothetical protein